MQKEQGRPASEIYDIATLARRETRGLAVWWTCWQFDRAVMTWGRWVENKLADYDAENKTYRYTLSDLLDLEPPQGLADLKAAFPRAVVTLPPSAAAE